MKVLIIRNAFDYDFGGAERLAVLLAVELRNNGISPIVMSRHKQVLDYADHKKIPRVKGWWWSQQNWSGLMNGLIPLYALWQLVLTLRYIYVIINNRIDVVHAMSKDDFISGTIAAKITHKKIIWTDTADLKYVYINVPRRFKNPIGSLIYTISRKVNMVAVVSQNEKKLIENELGGNCPTNYKVVYMVGPDEDVSPIERQNHEGIIFCATSRLVHAKGIAELIEAFNKASEVIPAAQLWIVGDGPEADKFKDQAAGIPNIEFFGHRKEPLRYLKAADIYVHPTHHEAFSLGLAEAAMLGKPIIATNVGGNPELVGKENGLLVPIKDSNALAEAMARLAKDEQLRQSMGLHGRSDFISKFDLQKVVKADIIPVYKSN